MTHLSRDDRLEAIDGTIDERGAAHLAACQDCRNEVEALRGTLKEAAAVSVPEPSPLFWDHFSARVRRAVDEAPAPRAWWQQPVVAALSSAAAVLLVIAIVLRTSPAPRGPLPAVASTPSASAPVDRADAPSTDDVWALLSAAASDMELNEAHAAGLAVRPSSVDEAVLELSPVERTELERLIRAELKRPGA